MGQIPGQIFGTQPPGQQAPPMNAPNMNAWNSSPNQSTLSRTLIGNTTTPGRQPKPKLSEDQSGSLGG
jgi:hypothetical protein